MRWEPDTHPAARFGRRVWPNYPHGNARHAFPGMVASGDRLACLSCRFGGGALRIAPLTVLISAVECPCQDSTTRSSPLRPRINRGTSPAYTGRWRCAVLCALRRHAAARHFRGGDLANHGPLVTQREADRQYETAIDEWLGEDTGSVDAVIALVEFDGVLAVDRLVAEIMREPTSDERDAYHQALALANAAQCINQRSLAEYTERVRERAQEGRP